MPITEEAPHHVHLERPRVLCDDPIADRSRLPAPLPLHTMAMLAIGRPGSGKSSFVHACFCVPKTNYNKLFRRVHWIAPPTSRQSFAGNVLKRHPRVYDKLDFETLEEIKRSAEEVSERGKGHHSILIADDVGSAMKNSDLVTSLRAVCWNRRHLRLSTWFLVQTYRSLHVDLRRCASHLCLWKSVNSLESDLVFQELLSQFMSKDD